MAEPTPARSRHKNEMLCWYCWIITSLSGHKLILKCTVSLYKDQLLKNLLCWAQTSHNSCASRKLSQNFLSRNHLLFHVSSLHDGNAQCWENFAIAENRTCPFLYSFQWSDNISKLSQYPKSVINHHCKNCSIYLVSNLSLISVIVGDTWVSYIL